MIAATVLTVTLRGDGMMKRREFVASLGALLATSPAEGQQPGRIYKIGYISPNIMPRTFSPLVRDAFNQTLGEFGFLIGENIVEEGRGRGAEGRPARLAEIAADLLRVNVDVIVAIGTGAVQVAHHASRTIPIVMAYVHDPVADGLIASLARPGGNVTGLATLGTDLGAKVMQLIKELMPRASRLVVITNPDSATSKRIVASVQETAKPLGLTLLPVEVGDVNDFERSFDAIKARRPDAIWVVSTVIGRDARPIELMVQHRLPSIYGSHRAVERGALLGFGENDAMLWRRVARYVGKILRSAKPGDLPVEQPPLELAINLKTAKALGVTIPQSLLLRADQVIE